MKRFSLIAFVVFLLLPIGVLLLSGPSQEADQDNPPAEPAAAAPLFRTVSAPEAAELMKTRKNLQVIDVRTPQERNELRIADSRLVPVGDVIRGVFDGAPDQPLMLVCAVGGRSFVAGKVMIARGYQEIYNLGGGIESWRQAGLPLETGPENPQP
ncbi:MAG: rhodanese-like domain-containing protein [Desulfofustis sp.]|nr:rhodanese-like domain-containing protein [Desulfofustis sp.]MBT8352880.1 rhodanese-like domain-containing protein [Desulfofustis sp.]NNF46516.1 rhodanese-like domain-containing protein [Desulfofustis sp.]NNK58243.1 rhodanese-like domain-containing protein [Desulfofustis sp.]